jgi:hypothetical protein
MKSRCFMVAHCGADGGTQGKSPRCVEGAQQLLQARSDLPLAEAAAHTGFSDQIQLSKDFKRLVGVTLG